MSLSTLMNKSIYALIMCSSVIAQFSACCHSANAQGTKNSSSGEPQETEVVVPAGTPVSLRATDWLAAGNPAGAVVPFKTASEVLVNGLIIVDEEAEARGHIVGYSSTEATKSISHGAAMMEVTESEASAIQWQPSVDPETKQKLCVLISLDWVKCVDGRKLRLKTQLVSQATDENSKDFVFSTSDGTRQWFLKPGLSVQASVASSGKVVARRKRPVIWSDRFAN
jgi:hypothetical protein